MVIYRTFQRIIGRAALIAGHLLLIALAIGVPVAFTMWMADAGRILALGLVVLIVGSLLVVGGDRLASSGRLRRRALA